MFDCQATITDQLDEKASFQFVAVSKKMLMLFIYNIISSKSNNFLCLI